MPKFKSKSILFIQVRRNENYKRGRKKFHLPTQYAMTMISLYQNLINRNITSTSLNFAFLSKSSPIRSPLA